MVRIDTLLLAESITGRALPLAFQVVGSLVALYNHVRYAVVVDVETLGSVCAGESCSYMGEEIELNRWTIDAGETPDKKHGSTLGATKRTYICPFANGPMFFSPDSRGFYTMYVRFWWFVQAQSSRAASGSAESI